MAILKNIAGVRSNKSHAAEKLAIAETALVVWKNVEKHAVQNSTKIFFA